MKRKILKSLFVAIVLNSLSLPLVFAETSEKETKRLQRSYGTTETYTQEETIYDNNIYWIKGYVTIDYDRYSGKIGQTTARSALLGVTYGHTWKPEPPRITVIDNIRRQVIFTGVITTNIFVGGVGEILADNVDHTVYVQSIATFEGPCHTCTTSKPV